MYQRFFRKLLKVWVFFSLTVLLNVNANAISMAYYWLEGGGPPSPLSLYKPINLMNSTFATNSAIKYAQENVIINADLAIKILSLDVNGKIGAQLNITAGNSSSPVIVGSILNSAQNDANALVISVDPGKALMLSGDNLTDNNDWAPSQVVNVGSDGVLNAGPLAANSVYSYQLQNGGPISYLFTNGSFITLDRGSNDPIASGDYTILGPYSYYNALKNISVGTGSSVIVQSTHVNNYTSNLLAPIIITPTVLPNTFTFTDKTATFDVESDTTITDATFGNIVDYDTNQHTGFANITGSSNATLNIDIKTNNRDPVTSDNNEITLSNIWTNKGGITFQNGIWHDGSSYLGTLKISTPVTITHSSIENIKTIVANNAMAALAPGSDINLNVVLETADSTLVVGSSNASDNTVLSFKIPQNFLYPPIDVHGNFIMSLLSHKNLRLTSISNQGSVVGSPSNRLKSFRMNGSDFGYGTIFLEVPVYSKEVSFGTKGSVLMGSNTINMGEGGTLKMEEDLDHSSYPNNIRLISNGTQQEPVFINLGSYYPLYPDSFASNALNVGTGANNDATSLLQFHGYVTINAYAKSVTYPAIESKVSKLNVHGKVGNTKSTLDLEGAVVTVNFIPDGGVLIGPPAQRFILLGTSGGGEILRSNTTVQFNPPALNDFGYNPLIKWTGNWDANNNYVINYSYNNAVFNEIVQQNASSAAQTIIAYLTTPQNGIITPTQATILSNLLSSLSANDVANIINIAESLVIASNTQEAAETALTTAIARIIDRATLGFTSSNFSGLVTEAGEGIAAGGTFADDEYKNGAWISGFAQKVEQKSYSNVPSYKAKSYGGSLGADTKISDNLLIGAAWTYTDSLMNHKGSSGDNKARLDNNIFSLYSLLNFSDTWLLHSSASIGFGKTQSMLMRYTGKGPSISKAKYSTRSYALNVQLSKMITFKDKFVFEPAVGLTYNQFDDQAYTERGGVLNWNVAKKHSYSVESLVGLSIATIYKYKDYIIKPNISGYAHINVKNKQGAVHTSLDGMAGGVALPASSASPVWYSIGAGFGLFKGAFELGVNYEAQIDKKYLGHQGTFKTRWNF